MFSTLGVFSTSGGYYEYIGGDQYIGDIMSTSGDTMSHQGYHEYIGGCSVHQGIS